MPSTLLPRRWALTPPFHPYPHRVPFEDGPKVFLRAITGLRAAGGIFSVALSVNSSTGFSLCFFFAGTFPTRVPPEASQTQVCATAPLALPGALPFTLRPYGPRVFSARAEWCPDFPPAQSACAFQASDRPAHPPLPLYREIRRSHRDCSPGGTPITSLRVASRIRLPSAPSLPVLSPCRTSIPGLCPLPHSPSSCSLTR
jgi:hypothetical protein